MYTAYYDDLTSSEQKVMNEFEVCCRLDSKANSTYKTYRGQIVGYLKWLSRNKARLQRETSERKVELFLQKRVIHDRVGPVCRDQAFNSLLYLYRRVLKMDVKEIRKIGRTRREKHLPVLLDRKQVLDVIAAIDDSPSAPYRLIACLLYGCGLRLAEALNLRIKDVSITESRLVLRNTKSKKDRTLRIPCYVMPALERQIKRVRLVWEQDRQTGLTTSMPGLDGIRRKYPQAPRSWGWYYVFIQPTPCPNPLAWPEERHILYRHHLNEKGVQRAVKTAAEKCGLDGVLTPHAFRHAFSTHLDERGEPLTVIQQLLGHQNIETTMIYVHRQQTSVRSPFDDAVDQLARPVALLPEPRPVPALPFAVA